MRRALVLVCVLALAAPAAAKTVEDIEALKKQVEAQAKSKNYPEALTLQRQLATKIESAETESVGKPGPKTAAALGDVAWCALHARDFAGALAASERAMALAPDLLWLATNKAHALLFLGRQGEARALYMAHKGKRLTPNSDKQWEDTIEEDFAAFREARLDHPAFDEIVSALGIDSALTREFAVLRVQNSALRKEGKDAKAVPLAVRLVAVAEKRYGETRTELAWALNNLALQYNSQGRTVEAEPLYKRSLAVREKALGPEHPDVAQSLNNLAGLYRAQGRTAEAEPLYKRSLAIREKALAEEGRVLT